MSVQNIFPFKTGLQTDLEPWIMPPDGFTEINNMHVHHGYIEKRQGYILYGTLAPNASTVNISTISQANPGEVTTGSAHGYSTGDQVYIASVAGMTEVNNKLYTITVTSTTQFTIGVNTTSYTAYTGSGTVQKVDTSVDRVMGISQYLDSTAAKTTFAWNTKRAFKFNSATNVFEILDSAAIMSGDDTNYIWAVNWQSNPSSSSSANRLYFTNGKAGTGGPPPTLDGIRYYDPDTSTTATQTLNAQLGGSGGSTRYLYGGKLLFTLNQRLIVLNTFEGTSSASAFPQRARWCAKLDPSKWDDTIAGQGGYTDAATGDQIVSAQILQNQLIVFFTNSVWALISTSDPNRAFQWKRINSFRACGGKMASQGYDRYIAALGDRGITGTDGVETRRIDQRIEDFTVDEINIEEFEKVFCARSYPNRRWWTLYPSGTSAENNAALIFDDESGAYSTYSINLNCLGYGNKGFDYSLNDFTAANNLDYSLDDFGDETLKDYFWQENASILLGGDRSGNINILESNNDDEGTSIECSFYSSAWNPGMPDNREARMIYIDFYIDTELETTATIELYKDTDRSPYATMMMDFLPPIKYLSGIVDVSKTNPVTVFSPEHGLTTGKTIYIYNVTGMTEINSGETEEAYTVTVVNEDTITLDGINGTGFSTYTGSGRIYARSFYRTRCWKRVFAGGVGFQHRIRFTSSGNDHPFRIHGFKPYFKPIGKRLIN